MKHETLKINEKEVEWNSWSKADEIEHSRKRVIAEEHINKLYCEDRKSTRLNSSH